MKYYLDKADYAEITTDYTEVKGQIASLFVEYLNDTEIEDRIKENLQKHIFEYICSSNNDNVLQNFLDTYNSTEKKADICVLDMDILDTRIRKDLTGEFISDIVIKILSYVAQKERESIRARQAEGIAIAKAQGKYQGRKPIAIDKVAFEKMYAEVVRGERTNRYAMQKLGLKPNTYYKAVNEYKTKTGQWGE